MANYELIIYFGVPGTGKTTFASKFSREALKHNIDVYSNFPLKNAFEVSVSDLGVYNIDSSLILLDEAGIDFDSRDWKNFSKKCTYFFKYYRHYKNTVFLFSQSYDDMDIKIRKLAQRLYLVKKSIIPFCCVAVPIRRKIGINELSKDIQDEFFFQPYWVSLLSWIFRLNMPAHQYCFAPKYWKYFDTYNRKELLFKEFKKWNT